MGQRLEQDRASFDLVTRVDIAVQETNGDTLDLVLNQDRYQPMNSSNIKWNQHITVGAETLGNP